MRRFLKILAWLVVGLLLAAVTLPWWMGGLVSVLKRQFGVEYAQYERVGYTRFALNEVLFQRESVKVSVKRAEIDTPLLWGWRHLRGKASSVFVKGWRVEIKSAEKSAPDPGAGWMSLRKELLSIADTLERWLPEARVEDGEVAFSGGPIGLSTATWRDRALQFDGLSWRGRSVQGLAAFISKDDLIGLQLATRENSSQLELESRGGKISGNVHWRKQPVTLTATFPNRGWLPVDAQAVAENWTLNGRELRLAGVYELVRGSGRVDWRKDSFVIDLSVKGEPVPNQDIPPLEVSAHGRGDLETFTIETLHAAIPGLDAHLTEPVRWNREGQLLSGPSRLTLEADLARQPWFSAEGHVTGEARIDTGRDSKPRVDVQLAAQALKVSRWSLPQLQVVGVLDWPSLQINNANFKLGANESIQLSGEMNLESKEVHEGKIEARLNGATVAGWFPGAPRFSSGWITAQFEGPRTALRHNGNAQIANLEVASLHPLTTELHWEATGDVVAKLTAEVSSGEARLSLNGAGDRNGVRLDGLRIQKKETTWLQLEKPAKIDWQPAIHIEPLVFSGEAGRIEVAGTAGVQGDVRFQVNEFTTDWLKDWFIWRGPDWRIASIDFSGRWEKGPMDFTLAAILGTSLSEQRPIELVLRATGDRDGVKLETFKVLEGQQDAITGNGALPVTISPASHPFLAVNSDAAMSFSAATRPDARFWRYFADATGLMFEHPQLNLELSGTWRAPRGKITLQMPRVAPLPDRFKRKIPEAEGVDVLVELDRDQIVLNKLSASVDGQQVQLDGRLPIPKGGVQALKNSSWKQLVRQATGHMQLPSAELSAIAAYAPTLIAPKGRLSIDVSLDHGQARGFLRIENAATRPLGPLGVLQDLKADFNLVGHGVEVRTLEAKMGSQTVTVKGTAALKSDGTPRFDFSLQGENLPFVRQVGLLMRGDLDLKLVSVEGGVGRITGKVKLRESLFSTDVRDLIPKGGGSAGPAARPPFFSVDPPPFNTWQLDVDLSGERFLRLHTPVFNGLASMNFHLANTLGEPRATGQAILDEGEVLLPFATFSLQQSSIRLTEANPYEPALFVTGTSRRYGYDLRMEVTGTASAPVLKFSSSPPLDSEKVLLMVMAGETPNDEVSYSGNQRAARFGAYIGKSLFSSVSGDSGAADRLTISTGEKVSRQGRETYDVEYRLGQRWSLVGEYDEFDDYNAGIKWQALRDKRPEKKRDAK